MLVVSTVVVFRAVVLKVVVFNVVLVVVLVVVVTSVVDELISGGFAAVVLVSFVAFETVCELRCNARTPKSMTRIRAAPTDLLKATPIS